jgi:hypothetical protein
LHCWADHFHILIISSHLTSLYSYLAYTYSPLNPFYFFLSFFLSFLLALLLTHLNTIGGAIQLQEQKALLGHDSNHVLVEEGGENTVSSPPPPPPPALPLKKKSDPAESFYITSLYAAYFLMPFWSISCILDYAFLGHIFSPQAFPMLALSGLMHALYNLSSFGFLSRVSTPTTHAIANVFKRVFTIWSAIVFFGNTDKVLSPLTIGGLLVSTVGLLWYGSLTAAAKASK